MKPFNSKTPNILIFCLTMDPSDFISSGISYLFITVQVLWFSNPSILDYISFIKASLYGSKKVFMIPGVSIFFFPVLNILSFFCKNLGCKKLESVMIPELGSMARV